MLKDSTQLSHLSEADGIFSTAAAAQHSTPTVCIFTCQGSEEVMTKNSPLTSSSEIL